MRVVGVVALAAGCGRLGFGEESRAPDAPPVASCIADEFDDDLIDAGLWTLVDPASPFPVNEQAGQLAIALSPGAAGYNGLQSVDAFSLTGTGDATIELVQPVSQAGFVDCGFGLVDPAGARYNLGVGGGNAVFMVISPGGVQDRTLAPYDPTTMRHLRITYDEAAAMIAWETSPDRLIWTTQRVLSSVPTLTPATAVIFAGAFQVGATTPGTATFDRFKLTTPACP